MRYKVRIFGYGDSEKKVNSIINEEVNNGYKPISIGGAGHSYGGYCYMLLKKIEWS